MAKEEVTKVKEDTDVTEEAFSGASIDPDRKIYDSEKIASQIMDSSCLEHQIEEMENDLLNWIIPNVSCNQLLSRHQVEKILYRVEQYIDDYYQDEASIVKQNLFIDWRKAKAE